MLPVVIRQDANFTLPTCTVQHSWSGKRVRITPAYLHTRAIAPPRVWPLQMSADTQTLDHTAIGYAGSGQYVASASSSLGSTGQPYRGFDKLSNTRWRTPSPRFQLSTGIYTGSQSFNGVSGEWLRLDFPPGFTPTITHFALYTNTVNGGMERGTLFGITAGGATVEVWSSNNISTTTALQQFALDVPGQYASFVFLIRRMHPNTFDYGLIIDITFLAAPVYPRLLRLAVTSGCATMERTCGILPGQGMRDEKDRTLLFFSSPVQDMGQLAAYQAFTNKTASIATDHDAEPASQVLQLVGDTLTFQVQNADGSVEADMGLRQLVAGFNVEVLD